MSTPQLITIILSIIAFITAVTIHEFCHALMAYMLGDPTAKQQGRLSLNPLSHIDPLGLLCMLIIRIGWARPVPFDARNFKFPRFFSVLVALAGPFSNILLALLSVIILHSFPLTSHNGSLAPFTLFFQYFAANNVMLGIFNLIPIPTLDGSHILRVSIPPQWEPLYDSYQKFSFFFLIILVNIPAFQKLFFGSITSTLTLLNTIAFHLVL
ncbi:site-2 protease family protein [Candidatus Dependentiae bacterium]|nr:site-2 protease family protein [Candidatus Dependentiae bacterium]